MHRPGGGLQLLSGQVAGPAEVALQQFPVGALVGDPVALAALLRLATCGKAACTALKGKGGNAGQPREPFLALRGEREDVSEDGGEGAVMFRISYGVGGSILAPDECMGCRFWHVCSLPSGASVLCKLFNSMRYFFDSYLTYIPVCFPKW